MEIIETLVTELINLVKTLAPELWQIFIKKTIYEGFSSLLIGLFLFITCILVWRKIYINYKDKKSKGFYYDFDVDYWCITLLIPFFISFIFLYNAGLYLLVPEYRAIELFLKAAGIQ
jgi:hypothetical protein